MERRWSFRKVLSSVAVAGMLTSIDEKRFSFEKR